MGGEEVTEKLRGERGRGEYRLQHAGEAGGGEHGGAAGADGESEKKQKMKNGLITREKIELN